jgi:hypothetical protein
MHRTYAISLALAVDLSTKDIFAAYNILKAWCSLRVYVLQAGEFMNFI